MSSNLHDADKTFIKNDRGFHPADEADLRHQKSPPSAAMPPELDADQDPVVSLSGMKTEELRERAAALAIKGTDELSREQLIQALAEYKRKIVDPDQENLH